MIVGGRPNLIGISGKMGSGKDTLAVVINYIADNFAPESIVHWEQSVKDWTYENKKYSEKLKYMVCFLLGCSRSDLEDRKFKETELGEEWWYYQYGESLYWYKTEKTLLTRVMNSELLEPCTEEDLNNCLIKLTPRKLLQLLGTEAGRQIIHPNIWVNALFSDYETDSKWIVTDVRFLNEAQAIKDKGGIMIRINRPQLIERNFEN